LQMEGTENKNTVHNFLTPTPPQWWLNAINLDFDVGVYRYALPASKPDYNLLVSLSWRIVKARGIDKLIPTTEFSKYISARVADELSFGRWIEVVAAPRTGKSAGALEGVVRWIIENDVKNYMVIVVAANRRLAENLYRYVLGAAIKVYKELKRNGVAINRGVLFERLRVRLYLGSEASCLLNKTIHYVEDCIRGCGLFKKYERKWRNIPPVPVLDPWVLKTAGYCPFIAASSKGYWYKSIVIVTAESLQFAIKNVLRHKIKRVVLVLDEYLVLLNRRGKLKEIDLDWAEKAFKDIIDEEFIIKGPQWDEGGNLGWVDVKVTLRQLLRVWNSGVKALNDIAVDYYTGKVKEYGSGLYFVNYMDELLSGVVDMKECINKKGYSVSEILLVMYSIGAALVDISKKIDKLEVSMRLKRLGYIMATNAVGMYTAIGRISPEDFSVSSVDKVVQLRWTMENDLQERVVGWAGGFVYASVSKLIDAGVEVAVVTTSVDSADVGFIRIYPHESLKHVRVSVDAIFKHVNAYSVSFNAKAAVTAKDDYEVVNSGTFRDLYNYLSLVMGRPGNSVIVGSKRIIQITAWILKNAGFKCVEEGDIVRGVIDYVLCDKRVGGQLLLVSPHSRVALGIDPPVRDPGEILLYGLRRPAREYIKVKRSINLKNRLVNELWDLRVVSFDNNTYYVYFNDDVQYSYIYVYDAFDAKFDIHMLIQVAGRWYMQKVEKLFYNGKYDVYMVKYFLVDFGVLTRDYAPFYVFKGFRLVDRTFKLPVLEPYTDFQIAVKDVVCYEREKDTVTRILEKEYEKSLRAVKKLKKGSDAWTVARAVSTLLNAFLYIEKAGELPGVWMKELYDEYVRAGTYKVVDALERQGLSIKKLIRLFVHERDADPDLYATFTRKITKKQSFVFSGGFWSVVS